MSRNTVITAIVVFVLIVGGWFLTRPKQPATFSPEPQSTQIPTSTESAAPLSATEGSKVANEKNLVIITSAGFSPSDITVSVGGTVVWMNSDTTAHTVNSVTHPTHTIYPPLNLDTIKPGEKKSLDFPKAGTYKYHDHLNPSLTGSVIVQ